MQSETNRERKNDMEISKIDKIGMMTYNWYGVCMTSLYSMETRLLAKKIVFYHILCLEKSYLNEREKKYKMNMNVIYTNIFNRMH